MSRKRSQPLLQKKIAEMERAATTIEREIGKAGLFADGVKTDFWKAIETKYKSELEAIESKLDNYTQLTDNAVRDYLAGRKRIRDFLGVKNFVKDKARFQNRLTILQGRIAEERAKLNG